MKKILYLFICLFWFSVCYADLDSWMGQDIDNLDSIDGASVAGLESWAGQTIPSGGGDEILRAHFENSDTITVGTPAGYNSNADQTWARDTNSVYVADSSEPGTSAPSAAGTYNLHTEVSGTKNAVITTDATKTAGTIVFDVYTKNGVGYIMRLDIDASNYFNISYSGSNIQVTYYGGTNSRQTSAAHTEDVWQTVTVKWQIASSPYLYIDIDGGTAGTNTNALDTLTGEFSTLETGQDFNGAEFHLDNLYLYDSWK